MNTNKFLALTYNGEYVNDTLLGKGIYTKDIPTIYPINHTIEKLILSFKMVKAAIDSNYINDDYIKNLSECELTEIEIKLIPK